MAKIREDLTGAVHVGGHVLFAGDDVPSGVKVGQWVTDGGGETGASAEFDPANHSGPDVIAYLDAAEPEEFDRVVTAEAEGKNRKTVLDAAAKRLAGEGGDDSEDNGGPGADDA